MKICIPILSKNKQEFLEDMKIIQKEPYDWIEWRIDCMESDIFEVASLLRMTFSCPIIATIRTEGNSSFHIDYVGLYKQLIDTKCMDYIDVEVKKDSQDLIEYAHSHGIRVIGSYHNFDAGLSRAEMIELYEMMKEKHMDMYKFAASPKTKEEVVEQLLTTYELFMDTQDSFISICMNEIGKISRIIGGLFGSFLTFACANKKSAPGQIPATLLKEAIDILHL